MCVCGGTLGTQIAVPAPRKSGKSWRSFSPQRPKSPLPCAGRSSPPPSSLWEHLPKKQNHRSVTRFRLWLAVRCQRGFGFPQAFCSSQKLLLSLLHAEPKKPAELAGATGETSGAGIHAPTVPSLASLTLC